MTKCRACEGTGRLPSIDWTVTKMRRQAESIFANTIYNEILVRADGRLLRAFAGEQDCWLKKLETHFGGTVILEAAEMGFGIFEIEKQKRS